MGKKGSLWRQTDRVGSWLWSLPLNELGQVAYSLSKAQFLCFTLVIPSVLCAYYHSSFKIQDRCPLPGVFLDLLPQCFYSMLTSLLTFSMWFMENVQ